MEQWSQNQLVSNELLDSLKKQNPETINGIVELHFSDGKIQVSKRMAFLNLFWLKIPAAFGIPLRKEHFIKRVPLNKGVLISEWTKYYDEIITLNRENNTALKTIVWEIIHDLYEYTSIDLLPWISSIDILDMTNVMLDEPMKEILESKNSIKLEAGIDVIEKFIDTKSKAIMELLGKKDGLKCKALYPYQAIKQLNPFQVPQTMFMFGVRTDISDTIVSYPVLGSAMSGLNNAMEFGVESLPAKKSAALNKVAVPDSQYFGRTMHLITSSVSKIYRTDCGSTRLVRFDVTQSNYTNIIGNYIGVEGKLVLVTKNNVKDYINTRIHMRSPGTCKFRKGVCEVCSGVLFDNLHSGTNIGIISAIRMIEPVTQKILSAKHLIKTNAIIYKLPKGTDEVLFRTTDNDLRWNPTFYDKLPEITMGIPMEYLNDIHDVTLLRSDRTIKEDRFGSVKHIVLKDTKGKSKNYLLEGGKQIPSMSAEFLLFLRDNYSRIVMDDTMMWVPLEGTEKFPIFRSPIINDNMLMFVKQVNDFLSKTVSTYSSFSDALQAFSEIVHHKVEINVAHLGVILKSFLITSPEDYRIPLVEDPENVMLGTIATILHLRHIGATLAYESLNRFVKNPNTFLQLKQESVFDLATVG